MPVPLSRRLLRQGYRYYFNTSNVPVPLKGPGAALVPLPDFNTSNVPVPRLKPAQGKERLNNFNTSNVPVPPGISP
mgnify:CR=1 FL=1